MKTVINYSKGIVEERNYKDIKSALKDTANIEGVDYIQMFLNKAKEKIYISGRITGTEDYLDKFQQIEHKLIKDGYSVINPAKILNELPKETDWSEYMYFAIKLMSKADTVYFMPDWLDSKGARIEMKYALENDKKIIMG